MKCRTCLQTFPSDEEYKLHFKSDYHRYNIKRTMIDLAAVSFDIYQQCN